MTVTGQVRTVTIVPTSPPSSSEQNTTTKKSKSFAHSPGKIAGLVIGLLAFFALLIVLALLWRRHKRNQQEAIPSTPVPDTPGGHSSNRTMSQLGGMGGSMASKYGDQPQIVIGGYDGRGGLPRRDSPPRLVDQRLDPGLTFSHDNASRVSMRSLQDNQDYSRKVLRVSQIRAND
jgi:cell wall integrity and stress response component